MLKLFRFLFVVSPFISWATSLAAPSKIIGERDFTRVYRDLSNLPHMLKAPADSVGMLVVPTYNLDNYNICTATHIGNGYILTAGHCLLRSAPVGATQNFIKSKPCSGAYTAWGYRGTDRYAKATSKSECEEIVIAEYINHRDYALIRINNPPKSAVSLAQQNQRPFLGTNITLFGHPQGRPLEWSGVCAINSYLPVQRIFRHQCDTELGNSGSPILTYGEKGDVTVVGVHVSEEVNSNSPYNYALHIKDLREFAAEKGISIDRVVYGYELLGK